MEGGSYHFCRPSRMTHLTPEQMQQVRDLAALKLLNVRFKEGTPYALLKYSRRAFYRQAWYDYPFLNELRGIVINWTTGEIISYPFTKVYNYGENEAARKLITPNAPVEMVRKVNGFLASTSMAPCGNFLVTSSGSFESPFVTMAEEHLNQISGLRKYLYDNRDLTLMWEITDPRDPHIVPEEPGAWLIGARVKTFGSELESESWLDVTAERWLPGARRPECSTGLFSDALERVKTVRHEGFIIRGLAGVVKLKSPYYLGRKYLARSQRSTLLWTNPDEFFRTVDEDHYLMADALRKSYTLEQWTALDETGKLEVLDTLYF